jgi:hypothetical protein
MLKRYLIILAFVLSSLIIIGCAPMPAAQQAAQQREPAYLANFEYTRTSQAAPNAAGVTFAVGNVFYKSNSKTPWFTWPQFANLDAAIKQDLTELLAAKGFAVRGPFDSYDLIPYSDKKAIDLYLVSTFEVSVIGSKEVYTLDDIKFEVTGKIVIQLKEIVTDELMWSKTIPLRKFESPSGFSNFVSVTWQNKDTYKYINDPSIKKAIESVELGTGGQNEVARGIEKQYPELMATISRLINPEEMEIIKKQCRELKSKKGY